MMATKFFAAIAAAFLMTTTVSANTTVSNSNEASPASALSAIIAPATGSKTVIKGFYKTVYGVDAQGRVVSKVILHKTNGSATEWVPKSAYSVFYGDSQNTLTYARWNGSSFIRNAQQINYSASEFPVLISIPE